MSEQQQSPGGIPAPLEAIHRPDGVHLDFDRLQRYIRGALAYGLPHATGSKDGWRTADPAALVDWLTTHLVAGISPALSDVIVNGSVEAARDILARERAVDGAA